MKWKIVEENPRKFADESYSLKAELRTVEGTFFLEVCWAQIMYALTVELVKNNEDPELVYDCMVFYEDRIEKYGHQIMRITQKSPFESFKRLYSLQKDGVLNHVLGEKYDVVFKTTLPESQNA